MATIRNEDFETMIQVEDLLQKKLTITNGIKDTFNGKEYTYFDENDEEYNIWVKYWNMVERFIQEKKVINNRSNQYNKNHRVYHRLTNNLYNARKNKNQEKIKYYEQKLKEYKEKEGE